MTTTVTPIYVCQDGVQPSGVATYGFAVLARYSSARMLLLNAGQTPRAVPGGCGGQLVTLLESASHDPVAVASAIREIVETCDGPVTIFPNTGDTPWAATAEFLRSAPAAMCERVRVLGIVHSDMETQYALAEQYRTIAPLWIGVSRRCAEELHRRVGGYGVVVHELPYPIAIPEPVVREPNGSLRLAYVGRLEEPQKRVSRLVEVFLALVGRGVDFTATVVGDGPAAEEFGRTLAAAGPAVVSRVRCVGAVGREAIDEIWRTHDVALLVSAFEGLPLALLEAMAAGVCPVVMAIESGLDELIGDGVEGCVVPQGDVEAMAVELAGLAKDRAGLRRMGCAARQRVRERFSPEVHFSRLTSILHEVRAHTVPAVAAFVSDPTAVAVQRLVVGAATSGRSVAVYGAGMIGRKVIDACLQHGLQIGAWFDSDIARAGSTYRGIVCATPASVSNWPGAVFIAASLQFTPEIVARIEKEFALAGKPRPEIVAVQP